MATATKTYESFHRAFHAMPAFLIGGFDPGYHDSIAGLGWLAQLAIDLYDEGEVSDITTPAQRATCVEFARKCGVKAD